MDKKEKKRVGEERYAQVFIMTVIGEKDQYKSRPRINIT